MKSYVFKLFRNLNYAWTIITINGFIVFLKGRGIPQLRDKLPRLYRLLRYFKVETRYGVSLHSYFIYLK